MTTEHEGLKDHEHFKELCALASTGTLTSAERDELKGHLRSCKECDEAHDQYMILATEGIPLLAATYTGAQDGTSWEDRAVREELFARVRASERHFAGRPVSQWPVASYFHFLRRGGGDHLMRAGLAACLVVAVGAAGYSWGSRRNLTAQLASISHSLPIPSAENRPSGEMREAQTKRLALLQEETLRKEQELTNLRTGMRALEQHANEVAAAGTRTEEQLRSASKEHDALSIRLRDAEHAYENVQAQLVNLLAEHAKELLQATAAESKIEELTAANQEQERRLKDNEQYFASDRDIRELMGARKLYIADVFDVDSHSRTRKPFGRVFYTEGKSLIFYAFDLERQAGMKNATAFQAWGKKDSGEQKPLSLGILYMDNEANRRWVLRCDDPKQLAEINAVFVTVEPSGGSNRPTGKPFLYASLQREVNHP